jgi:predicted aspartyl protease
MDTGAETTVLHKSIADKLNIASTKTRKSKVADGRIIDSKVAYIDYLVIGRNVMENVEIKIIKQETPSGIEQGLLGMNFLKNLNFTIDFNRKVVKWNYKMAKNE